MWECKGRKDGRGEWGGPDFMTVEGPGFSLSGPGSMRMSVRVAVTVVAHSVLYILAISRIG